MRGSNLSMFQQGFWTTHHSALITMEVLDDLLRIFIPQEDVPTVGPRDDVLTVRPGRNSRLSLNIKTETSWSNPVDLLLSGRQMGVVADQFVSWNYFNSRTLKLYLFLILTVKMIKRHQKDFSVGWLHIHTCGIIPVAPVSLDEICTIAVVVIKQVDILIIVRTKYFCNVCTLCKLCEQFRFWIKPSILGMMQFDFDISECT